MFQDVLDTQNYGRDTIRQMIISTPIFDDSGKIRNILAVVRPLDRLNQLYYHPGGVRLLHQRPAGFAAGKGLRRHR